jgi:hypothetical protein
MAFLCAIKSKNSKLNMKNTILPPGILRKGVYEEDCDRVKIHFVL